MTMLEKVARAMYERPTGAGDNERSFDDLFSMEKEMLIADARAALMAMLVPEDDTIGDNDWFWNYRLNAILAEGGSD